MPHRNQGRFSCGACGENKAISDYQPDARTRRGHRLVCRACKKHYDRRRKLLKRYGLTLDEFLQKLEKQKWKCGACGIKLALEGSRFSVACVDHNHRTGQIRGILCGRCNLAAGMLKDCSIRAGRLKNYLRKWGC